MPTPFLRYRVGLKSIPTVSFTAAFPANSVNEKMTHLARCLSANMGTQAAPSRTHFHSFSRSSASAHVCRLDERISHLFCFAPPLHVLFFRTLARIRSHMCRLDELISAPTMPPRPLLSNARAHSRHPLSLAPHLRQRSAGAVA
jgi:hypothetical protein